MLLLEAVWCCAVYQNMFKTKFISIKRLGKILFAQNLNNLRYVFENFCLKAFGLKSPLNMNYGKC